MDKDILDLKTVDECNRCFGVETLHPLVTVIGDESLCRVSGAVRFSFYAVVLVEGCHCDCRSCGWRHYDFASAMMLFLSPGEVLRPGDAALAGRDRLLAFHPDLLSGFPRGVDIADYTFFNYSRDEALHLSQRECGTVGCCLSNLEDELRHPVDTHSAVILSRHLGLMLDYCTRYYERQFITRENKNKTLLDAFCRMVDDYLATGKLRGGGLPAPGVFAVSLGLSDAYLCDLLRFETGNTFQSFVKLRQMEVAKRMLLVSDASPEEISRWLGFPSVQYFTFLFKSLTGVAPRDYAVGGC